MAKEMCVNMTELLRVEDKAYELEIVAEKARVVLSEVQDYSTEMDDGYFAFYRKQNEVKARIAFDYICELEDEIEKLKEQINKLRHNEVEENRKCA